MLIIFFGNIGVGKTTLAEAFARMNNFEFICFDKMVHESSGRKKMYSEDDKFLLSAAEISKVYADMHLLAANKIKQGKTVVLESMYFEKQRYDAKLIARTLNVKYKVVEVVCDENIVKERLEQRKEIHSQSGGFNLYLEYKQFLEPEKEEHSKIDTTNKDLFESLKELESKLYLD